MKLALDLVVAKEMQLLFLRINTHSEKGHPGNNVMVVAKYIKKLDAQAGDLFPACV